MNKIIRICLVCHNADQTSLKNCSRCQCVAYCSDECREEDEELHSTVCSSLRNCILDHRMQVTRGDRLRCYLPPMSPESRQLNTDFESVFSRDCDKLFTEDDCQDYRESQVRQLTYTYTCPATVLHACHVAQLTSASGLVIHVVGARTAEVDDAAAWSIIPATIPNIKK